MLISAAFASKYIKSNDLGGQRHKLQIMSVTIEEIADGEQKPVMRFIGRKKGMVLNKTNATALAAAFGDDTITWQGRSIELLAMPTMFQGKQVMGLVCLPILEQEQVSPSRTAEPLFDDQAQFRKPGPHDAMIQPRQVGDLAQSETGPVPQNPDDISF